MAFNGALRTGYHELGGVLFLYCFFTTAFGCLHHIPPGCGSSFAASCSGDSAAASLLPADLCVPLDRLVRPRRVVAAAASARATLLPLLPLLESAQVSVAAEGTDLNEEEQGERARPRAGAGVVMATIAHLSQ